MKNTIVIYYSLGGNTEFVADSIIKELKCDSHKIELKKDSIKKPRSKYFLAGIQTMFNKNPELSESDVNLENYENIIVGAPVWSGSVVPPVRRFFEKEIVTGKNIYIFYCYISDEGNAFTKLSELFEGNSVKSHMGFKSPLKNGNELSIKIGQFVGEIKGRNSKISREEILRAGREQIIKNGYEKTKVEEIMKSLDSAKGGFYYYFESKKDLMLEVFGRDFRVCINNAIAENDVEDKSSAQKLEGVLSVVLGQSQGKYVDRYFRNGIPDEIHPSLDNLKNELLLPVIVDLIEKGNDTGEFHVENTKIVSDIIFRGISSFIHDNYKKFSEEGYYAEVKNAFDEIIGKILGQHGNPSQDKIHKTQIKKTEKNMKIREK